MADETKTKPDNIMKTGSLLGVFGTILVGILAIINVLTYDQIIFATNDLEDRARKEVFPNTSFSTKPIYVIKQNEDAYNIFNEIVNPPNFDEIKEQKYIEYTYQNPDDKIINDRLSLKQDPVVVSQEQATQIKQKLNDIRVKPITYYEAYEEKENNKIIEGWVIKHSATGGYGGNINMLIGFDKKSKITGYLMVQHNETPGLGVKANYKEFINPFIGKEAKDMPITKKDFPIKLGINAISGATITSVAVTKGVQKAYEILSINKNPVAETKENEENKDKDKEEQLTKKNESEDKKQSKKEITKTTTEETDKKKVNNKKPVSKKPTKQTILQQIEETERTNEQDKKAIRSLFKNE